MLTQVESQLREPPPLPRRAPAALRRPAPHGELGRADVHRRDVRAAEPERRSAHGHERAARRLVHALEDDRRGQARPAAPRELERLLAGRLLHERVVAPHPGDPHRDGDDAARLADLPEAVGPRRRVLPRRRQEREREGVEPPVALDGRMVAAARRRRVRHRRGARGDGRGGRRFRAKLAEDRWQAARRSIAEGARGAGRLADPARPARRERAAAPRRRSCSTQGAVVLEATKPFEANGKTYPAGHARSCPRRSRSAASCATSSSRRSTPSGRRVPTALPEPPFDWTGWTPAMQMGVVVERVVAWPGADVTKSDGVRRRDGRARRDRVGQPRDARVVARGRTRLGAAVPVAPPRRRPESRPAVALPGGANGRREARAPRRRLPAVDREHGRGLDPLDPRAVRAAVPHAARRRRACRRPPRALRHDPAAVDRRAEHARGARRRARCRPEYCGGLGAEGEAALAAFVREGGRLVCLDASCDYALQMFPSARAAGRGRDGEARREEVLVPGVAPRRRPRGRDAAQLRRCSSVSRHSSSCRSRRAARSRSRPRAPPQKSRRRRSRATPSATSAARAGSSAPEHIAGKAMALIATVGRGPGRALRRAGRVPRPVRGLVPVAVQCALPGLTDRRLQRLVGSIGTGGRAQLGRGCSVASLSLLLALSGCARVTSSSASRDDSCGGRLEAAWVWFDPPADRPAGLLVNMIHFGSHEYFEEVQAELDRAAVVFIEGIRGRLRRRVGATRVPRNDALDQTGAGDRGSRVRAPARDPARSSRHAPELRVRGLDRGRAPASKCRSIATCSGISCLRETVQRIVDQEAEHPAAASIPELSHEELAAFVRRGPLRRAGRGAPAEPPDEDPALIRGRNEAVLRSLLDDGADAASSRSATAPITAPTSRARSKPSATGASARPGTASSASTARRTRT